MRWMFHEGIHQIVAKALDCLAIAYKVGEFSVKRLCARAMSNTTCTDGILCASEVGTAAGSSGATVKAACCGGSASTVLCPWWGRSMRSRFRERRFAAFVAKDSRDRMLNATVNIRRGPIMGRIRVSERDKCVRLSHGEVVRGRSAVVHDCEPASVIPSKVT